MTERSRQPPGRGTRLFVAALAVAACFGAPLPALSQAGDVVLENVRLAFGPVSYRLPRLEIRGTAQSQAEIAAILDTSSAEPASQRLSRLSAREIVVPSLISEIDGPDGRSSTTYRNVVLGDVQSGQVATVTAADGTVESRNGPLTTSASFDRLTMGAVDMVLAAVLANDTGGAAPAPLKRLYGSFVLEGLNVLDGNGVRTRAGRFAGRDFSARPSREGWVGLTRLLGDTPDLKAASPERRRRVVDGALDLFDSFEIGALEVSDIDFTGPPRAGSSGRIAKLAYVGGGSSGASEIRMEGFETASPDLKLNIASIGVGGLSFKPLLETLRDGAEPGGMSAADLRRALPLSGSAFASGIAVEVAGKPGRTGAIAPMRVTLGAVEVAAGKPVGGLPSDMTVAVRNVAIPVPPNSTDPNLKQIASLGYERLDLSFKASLGWNEPGQEIILRELSVEGGDMGSATVRGVLGNVSKDVFDPDTAIASVALVGAAAKSLDLAIENRGLAERILNRDARLKRRSVEDLRREYGMMAAIGIPAMLGASPASRTIGQAVARFIAKPGSLLIQARARGPNGFGFADFAAGPDPSAVLEQLDVTATAE